MKVLVTGGAGYIGSHMVDLLVEKGHNVVAFDNLRTGHKAAVHKAAEFIEGDLLNRDVVFNTFEAHKFDGVFHFASYTLVGESMSKPWLYMRDNILAASNLLEAVTEHSVQRFILSSTANLFDDPQKIPIAENERIQPGSPYGESKSMIERQLHWMDQIYGLKYCCLRYFNAAGAHPNAHIGEDHDPETHIIPIVLQVALGQREKVTIFGDDYDTQDGTCIRDYIHVVDLANAHIVAFDAIQDGESRRYNLGTGKGHSIKELVEVAQKVTNRPIKIETGPRRPGDPAELVADSSRFTQELGWKPEFNTLEGIVHSAWNWHQKHPRGYGDRT